MSIKKLLILSALTFLMSGCGSSSGGNRMPIGKVQTPAPESQSQPDTIPELKVFEINRIKITFLKRINLVKWQSISIHERSVLAGALLDQALYEIRSLNWQQVKPKDLDSMLAQLRGRIFDQEFNIINKGF